MPATLVSNEVIALTENVSKCEDFKTSCVAEPDKTEIIHENRPEPARNYDLRKFRLQRILNNNTRNKSIALLGTFPDLSECDMAIIIFEKQPFKENDIATDDVIPHNEGALKNESLTNSFFCRDLKVQTEFINNIYGSFQCTPPANLNGVKATVVYPATEKHIEKYSISQKFIIKETSQLYKEVTLPYIISSQFSLEWVYNILEHKQESERIIFEDPDPKIGFIVLPDLKWDGKNIENLYVLVITHQRDIKSLRDLNSSHLPLLRNIRTRAAEAIEARYGIPSTQLRMYFHYQPSFYHLHVHINPLRNDVPGIWCEKSHMIDTVINNLELLPDYYNKATLPFVLYEGNSLLELYEDKLSIRKAIKRIADTDAENDIEVQKPKIGDESTEEGKDNTIAVTN